MEDILFSILVPVYNVEKYIRHCIDSVLGQTYSNFELILVDDGSPDNSGRICDEYASNDSRIIVIHKENGGQLSARVSAIKRAKGNWCVFLDSDDYLEPNILELLSQKIITTDSDCVYYGWKNVDNEGKKINESGDIAQEFVVENKRDLYRGVFLNNGFNSLCRKAVRRDLLSDTDYAEFYSIRHGEDLLQSLEIFKNAQKVLFIPDNLYNYRINPNSITHTVNYQNYVVDFTVRQKVLDFLKNENVWTDTDYIEYWNYCVSLFVVEIIRVSNFSASYKTIKSFYKDLAKTEYYMTFLSNERHKTDNSILSKNKERIFVAFKHKRYLLVYLMLRIKRMFGHI